MVSQCSVHGMSVFSPWSVSVQSMVSQCSVHGLSVFSPWSVSVQSVFRLIHNHIHINLFISSKGM